MKVTIEIDIPRWLARIAVALLLLYRRLRYGYPFRRIPLSQGMFAIVDPEDYDRVRRYKWHVHKRSHTAYAVHKRSAAGKRKRTNLPMHRLILDVPPGLCCDHINGNGLDNRKANLRPATHTQNAWNRRPSPRSICSPFKGVDLAPKGGLWRARIRANGRLIYLGTFNSEIEAAKAYDQAARKWHGAFAALNFPREKPC